MKNPAKYGIIISGALDANSKEASKHAKQYYETVRKMRTDVQRIAKNTGWKETAIKKIKDHIFFAEHDIYGEMRRFDPSYHMAETWQRLINGGKEIQEQDYVLLKHEYLEQLLENTGYTHDKAHTIASAKHDYAKYTK